MISFNNIDDFSEVYLGDVSILEVYSGNHKVWPKDEPFESKVTLYMSDSSIVEIPCDETGILERGDISEYRTDTTSITVNDCCNEIADDAFMYFENVVNCTISDNVKKIGATAFYGNQSLISLTIGTGITEIGLVIFYSCDNFKNLYIKAVTPPSLPSKLFNNNNERDFTIYVPCGSEEAYKSATNWSQYADRIVGWDFEKDSECDEPSTDDMLVRYYNDGTSTSYPCDDTGILNESKSKSGVTDDEITGYSKTITSITIGDCTTDINENTFKNWIRLKGDLTIPDNVKTISREAFGNCTGLNGELRFGKSLTTIGNGAFSGCSGFTGSLVLPNGLEYIDWYSFYGCTGFTGDLIIPDSVTNLGYYSFMFCSGFDGKLKIGSGVTNIQNYAFDSCSGLTSLELSDSVTSIGQSVFRNCKNITGDLAIPNKCNTISNSAFEGCSSLNSVTIPSSVTQLGSAVFRGCTSLTEVVIYNLTPPNLSGTGSFDNTNDCPIYVPDESINKYIIATNWSKYKDRIKPISERGV